MQSVAAHACPMRVALPAGRHWDVEGPSYLFADATMHPISTGAQDESVRNSN